MTNEDIEQICRISRKRVREVPLSLKRYLYQTIDWSDRLVCIKGVRGVGKTTLMLQHMREQADNMDALYASLDNSMAIFALMTNSFLKLEKKARDSNKSRISSTVMSSRTMWRLALETRFRFGFSDSCTETKDNVAKFPSSFWRTIRLRSSYG